MSHNGSESGKIVVRVATFYKNPDNNFYRTYNDKEYIAMQYTHLGREGLLVSRLCLGTMNFGPQTTEPDSYAIMDHALELGFNFFDTANVYGWKKGEGVTEQAIYNIVVGYAEKLANQGIAPHDLRRTFAKLAHKGGSPIDQIQLSLGHDSIQTTEKYLGVEQDLTDAPCDHLGIKIK